eukprot:PLAT13836.1.p1 GENE.PLAT13836.1~~PLAT13836.1.p1  ORF type:complete len:342 (-),score=109.54 PLAT13836.1:60-1052(-)
MLPRLRHCARPALPRLVQHLCTTAPTQQRAVSAVRHRWHNLLPHMATLRAPLRQCVLTRKRLPRSLLLRFVRAMKADPETGRRQVTLLPDLNCSLPGAGVYVTACRAALSTKRSRKALTRAVKGHARLEVTADDVAAALRARCAALLRAAVQEGLVVVEEDAMLALAAAARDAPQDAPPAVHTPLPLLIWLPPAMETGGDEAAAGSAAGAAAHSSTGSDGKPSSDAQVQPRLLRLASRLDELQAGCYGDGTAAGGLISHLPPQLWTTALDSRLQEQDCWRTALAAALPPAERRQQLPAVVGVRLSTYAASLFIDGMRAARMMDLPVRDRP